jgi:hypothetical protein
MFGKSLLVIFLNSLGFRIRGGLFEKLPLKKFFFALSFATSTCWLKDNWNLYYFVVIFIASRLCTQLAGWGEGVICALGIDKPDPHRIDMYEADNFCNTFEIQERDIKIWKWDIHIPHFKLIDHPQLWGVTYLTIRGVYLSFILGLALNSIEYMLWGLPMGLIYWFSGWLFRKCYIDDGKYGWRTAEWLFGGYLGLGLTIYA